MLRVLIVSNLYPSPRHPGWGTFIRDQVRSLEGHVSIRLVAKRSPSAAAYPDFLLRTAAALLEGDHDLVHAHYGFHSALLPALLGRRPLIVTFHGSDALIEVGRNALYGHLQRYVVRRARHLIAVSSGVRAALVRSLGAPAERVRLLSCGVDAERFRPGDQAEARARLGLPREGRRVLFIGRMTMAKGIDVLGACIERLTSVEFDLLGPGAPPCGAANCRAHGVRPHEEVPLWIQAADLVVLPSRTEGTPVTVLEALAAERPVVCTEVGDCAELVVPGVTGEVAPPGDAEAFAAAVRRALASPGYRLQEGRAKILGKYELRLRARELLALYEEVCAAGSAQRG